MNDDEKIVFKILKIIGMFWIGFGFILSVYYGLTHNGLKSFLNAMMVCLAFPALAVLSSFLYAYFSHQDRNESENIISDSCNIKLAELKTGITIILLMILCFALYEFI